MKFSELLGAIHSFTSVCFDTRKLQAGCIFVAVRGGSVDGHSFLQEAAGKGAAALVVEDISCVPRGFSGSVTAVADARAALNVLASHFFHEPARKLFCVGVTGTNGKTTTTHLIEAILNRGDSPTGVIGTIDHHLHVAGHSHAWKTEMTTPDPISFQERLSEFVRLGARAVALEVSSHALHQSRVDEVPFDVALFTNLTRDHLDYHRGMDDYFAAKQKLFTQLLAHSTKPKRTAIVNGDDPYGRRLVDVKGVTTWVYGRDEIADLSFTILEQGFGGTRFRLRSPVGSGDFHVRMPGLHNVYNAASAIGTGLAFGVLLHACAEALDKFPGVKGRLESVPNSRGLHIFVDYAHSDDAIRTILRYLNAIREEAKIDNRILTVFGCGGDRDKGKRPLMMRAACEGSDVVVLTSDNPRTEDPEAIMRDALAGAEPEALGRRVFQEVDRAKGIALALSHARSGDVVVIAGKGHEDYQIIGTKRSPFSDVEVVKGILG